MSLLARSLEERRLPLGGWSCLKTSQTSVEATSVAAMALRSEPSAASGSGIDQLLRLQRQDGRLPAFLGDSEGSWTTALALCALNEMSDFAGARDNAFHWLTAERGREPHWFWRWKFKTRRSQRSLRPRQVRACPTPKICPCRAASLSAKIVHSHAGHNSVYVSVRSTAGFWASSRRCREPSVATAASRLQEETQTAYAEALGSAVLVGLSQVWSDWSHALVFVQPDTVARWQRERFRRFWAQLSRPKGPRRGRPAVCEGNPQTDPADGHRRSPVASSENSWRAEDAGHWHIGANRITDSADCSTATFSDGRFSAITLDRSYRLTSLLFRQSGCGCCSYSWFWSIADARCSTST